MTSPTTGWVILEGDWNYCEFQGNLFFLKKSKVISHHRNKWFYILIKDHICSLYKNTSNVEAFGTLINTHLDNSKLNFQTAFPVFNRFNNRILIPIAKEDFNWRTHAKIVKINKTFDYYCPVTDVQFSNFITVLEANRDFLTKTPDKQWSEVVKNNKYLVLLGNLSSSCSPKVKGWKNELVEKINELLDIIPSAQDIILGVVTGGATIQKATKLNGRYAISYRAGNPLFSVVQENKEIDINLGGLTDIELINFDDPSPAEKYSKDYFNLFLNYDASLVEHKYKTDLIDEITYIKKLTRRVRLPFFNEYSSRAIYKKGGRHYSFHCDHPAGYKDYFYPQKVFIKGAKQLVPKQGTDKYPNYPTERTGNSYRSVYLYWCFNLNFYFAWGKSGFTTSFFNFYSGERKKWIDNTAYFTDETKQNMLRAISNDMGYKSDVSGSINLICTRKQDMYYENKLYPWNTVKEPINIGWLIGQFSPFISGQENVFETEFPFIVKTGIVNSRTLKRIIGLNEDVANLIHLDDLYDAQAFPHRYTLDCFLPLSHRQREKSVEEDFLIGEKLLFTTWGMAPYLLFQPACFTYDRLGHTYLATRIIGTFGIGFAWGPTDEELATYGYYNWDDLDDYYNPQLFGKWIDYASYRYPYTVFDEGHAFKENAKGWYKKAYENYAPLTYKRFYENPEKYRELKQHIVKNTGAYFKTQEVSFKNNEIKELKVNDIFYSQDEWFWFDASDGKVLGATGAGDFFFKLPDAQLEGSNKLTNGDIVCYLNPKDNKVYLGTVKVLEDEVLLPDNQFIATGSSISDSSSSSNKYATRHIRITPAPLDVVARENVKFESLDECISTLKSARYIKQFQPQNLQQLQQTGRSYLFNLKGTPFFCLFDRQGKISLVFKNKEKYEESEHIPD